MNLNSFPKLSSHVYIIIYKYFDQRNETIKKYGNGNSKRYDFLTVQLYSLPSLSPPGIVKKNNFA